MVSYRLKEYGVSDIVVGDLVHGCHSSSSHSAGNETTVHVPQAEQLDQDSAKTHCTSTASSETTQAHETTKDKKTTRLDSAVSAQQDITRNIDKAQVKVVTEEDVRIGKYTIRDLVLPIPGYNVLYPTNSVKERYYIYFNKQFWK
jgi:Na+-transporting NADH:ubiquinone oxidoreductase subunit NqrC